MRALVASAAVVAAVGCGETAAQVMWRDPGPPVLLVKQDYPEDVLSRAVDEHERGRLAALAARAGEVFRDTLKDGSRGPEMVIITPGSFEMGSSAHEVGRNEDEGPLHRVTVQHPFAFGKYELTVAEFGRFVEATGYRTDAERNTGSVTGCKAYEQASKPQRGWRAWASWKKSSQVQGNQPRHPVTCVSWNDAQAYVEWLSGQTGKFYRLPTEAEWEYAARAGTTESRYWGDDPDKACKYANVADETPKPPGNFEWDKEARHHCSDGYAYVAPVGSFKANRFGLYDILGNVREWTGDCWHDSYQGAPANGDEWIEGSCQHNVFRGGGWAEGSADVRSASRNGGGDVFRSDDVGIRVAQEL